MPHAVTYATSVNGYNSCIPMTWPYLYDTNSKVLIEGVHVTSPGRQILHISDICVYVPPF